MKYRQGDRVSVLGIVKHNQSEDKRVFVDVIGSHDTLWLEPKDMTLVAASFDVGDKCQWGISADSPLHPQTSIGTILAISDGHAWIDMGGGNYCTRLLSTIERVDSDDE